MSTKITINVPDGVSISDTIQHVKWAIAQREQACRDYGLRLADTEMGYDDGSSFMVECDL